MTIKIEEHLDHQRWLINNGLINDFHKDTLYLYGSLIHKDVKAVELQISPELRRLDYKVYVSSSLLKSYNLFNELKNSSSIIDLWRVKRLLKTNGNLNFVHILKEFVHAYCGPKWEIGLSIEDFKNYEDDFKQNEQKSEVDISTNIESDKK